MDLHFCTTNDRHTAEMSERWDCPACTTLTQTERAQRKAYAEHDETLHIKWHPSWEPTEMLVSNPDFKAHVQQFEHSQCSAQEPIPPMDSAIDNLTRQGFHGSTHELKSHWTTTQGHKNRQNAFFNIQTINPQLDIEPTWKCEIWIRDIHTVVRGTNVSGDGSPKPPETTTRQAACVYNANGQCTGMLSLHRLNILIHAFNQAKASGTHDVIQPPVQSLKAEISGCSKDTSCKCPPTRIPARKSEIRCISLPLHIFSPLLCSCE